MKLWQKIFLLTLALVMVVVNVTSLVLLSNSHRLAIEREQANAVERHNYLIAELQNAIVYTQLSDRIITLDDPAVLNVSRDVLNRQRSDTTSGAALYRNQTLLYAVSDAPLASQADLLSEPDYTSRIITAPDKSIFLLMVSTVELNGTSYQLVTSDDITSAYTLFNQQLVMVRIVGVVSGLVVAGLLLALVVGLLGPLRALGATTRQIAAGDLQKRAPVRGNDEVANVARSLNVMADAIEHNVTKLEGLAESRRLFIGNLAHEMKTPLTSILGFADILRIKREVNDSDRIEYASVIVSETKRLQGLSGKLMELLSVGSTELTMEDISLADLGHELGMTMQPVFDKREVTFSNQLGQGNGNGHIRADRELIKSLLYNLIDNASKASTPGATVTIASTVGPPGVVIWVADEGIGIPPEQIPLLTEPFYMVDKARTRKAGGAGLGLAICNEIARVHGATLKIESRQGEGHGTRVTITFPAPTAAGDATSAAAGANRAQEGEPPQKAEAQHGGSQSEVPCDPAAAGPKEEDTDAQA
jgi:signal transduction histidine kinase